MCCHAYMVMYCRIAYVWVYVMVTDIICFNEVTRKPQTWKTKTGPKQINLRGRCTMWMREMFLFRSFVSNARSPVLYPPFPQRFVCRISPRLWRHYMVGGWGGRIFVPFFLSFLYHVFHFEKGVNHLFACPSVRPYARCFSAWSAEVLAQ